jgi:hypothetical protein
MNFERIRLLREAEDLAMTEKREAEKPAMRGKREVEGSQ